MEKILVADDNPQIRALVKEILENEGYTVVTAEHGADAVEKIYKENPALCIIDYEMPHKKGFDVVREVRSHTAYIYMPIMIFTADAGKQTRMEGLGLDIDDYLNKPADAEEIVARVKLLLRRSKQKLDSNPLTRLPGNPSIQADIEDRIAANRPFAMLYCDLNNFKAFNDKYGFEAGDRVLKKTADIIAEASKSGENAFVGNVGGDDFVLSCDFDAADEIAKKIIELLDAAAPSFYDEADRAQGFMSAKDRQGVLQKIPLLSIGIGIVHNTIRPITSFAMASSIAAEVKSFAKKQPGSNYIFDRREN
ncbi:MAG: response regulator [Elusimicrobium sp.]|jgi:diguanylate cyclase (GGDEF)-like protein|nr:response regulator [Elusimicrobium sp.]